MDGSPPGSSVHGILQAKYWSGLPCPPPGDFPKPAIEPRSLASQASSLPSEPLGKPMNTGVTSLSLLQGIFLTQELNPGLLHCRRILYQLSYQRSPYACLPMYTCMCMCMCIYSVFMFLLLDLTKNVIFNCKLLPMKYLGKKNLRDLLELTEFIHSTKYSVNIYCIGIMKYNFRG